MGGTSLVQKLYALAMRTNIFNAIGNIFSLHENFIFVIQVAAMCCYHGPLDAHSREELINDWRERTYFNEFDTNKA